MTPATEVDDPTHDHFSASLQGRRLTLSKLATITVIVAIVYFAKDVFLPLSIAMLITFALSPLATRLRKLGLPNIVAVLAVVTAAFLTIALFFLTVFSQLSVLAQNLPAFQANIITKVETLREASSENGMVSRLTNMLSAINAEIGAAVPAESDPTTGAPNPRPTDPLKVEVIENQSPFAILQDLVLPLISPIATTGLVIVVVIFMLLQRTDLRDRFIKLVGSNDLHRTTQVLQDAGQRVAQYLLVQLLVNIIYAVPIAVGLWLIGVPNAPLWGMLTLVFRFVPYIGTVLAAAFPLFLAFAVSPGWTAVLLTIALFGVVELVTSNMIEPYLYGSRTGVSPLAIILSAIFWTWLWGPLGLVLSTPLTVCLVVLGRHLPQFEVFDTLFGDEPVLDPQAQLYQRLLVGDAVEATFRAEETLETLYLAEYYRDVGIPALLIAQNDHTRGVLSTDERARFAKVAATVVSDLEEVVTEELQDLRDESPSPADAAGADNDPAAGAGYRVICVGGRSELDDVAALMLAQTLATKGATASHRAHTDMSPSRLRDLAAEDHDCIVINFLDRAPSRASFLHIRRLKQAAPKMRVGVVIWDHLPPKDALAGRSLIAPLPEVTEATLQQARDIGADFAVTSLDAALKAAFLDEPSKPLPEATGRLKGLRAARASIPSGAKSKKAAQTIAAAT